MHNHAPPTKFKKHLECPDYFFLPYSTFTCFINPIYYNCYFGIRGATKNNNCTFRCLSANKSVQKASVFHYNKPKKTFFEVFTSNFADPSPLMTVIFLAATLNSLPWCSKEQHDSDESVENHGEHQRDKVEEGDVGEEHGDVHHRRAGVLKVAFRYLQL